VRCARIAYCHYAPTSPFYLPAHQRASTNRRSKRRAKSTRSRRMKADSRQRRTGDGRVLRETADKNESRVISRLFASIKLCCGFVAHAHARAVLAARLRTAFAPCTSVRWIAIRQAYRYATHPVSQYKSRTLRSAGVSIIKVPHKTRRHGMLPRNQLRSYAGYDRFRSVV